MPNQEKRPWTAGPWEAGRWDVFAVVNGKRESIVDCDVPAGSHLESEDIQANAHLIAAAPQMYEALKAAEIALVNSMPIGWTPGQDFLGVKDFDPLAEVRAALSAALGKTEVSR